MRTPPSVSDNLSVWAEKLVRYLAQTANRLSFKSAQASASEDGVILWDAANGYPVVSSGGAFKQVYTASGLAAYTVATLPSALDVGAMIYVSDETGGATIAFSDGSNWRRVQDRAVVS